MNGEGYASPYCDGPYCDGPCSQDSQQHVFPVSERKPTAADVERACVVKDGAVTHRGGCWNCQRAQDTDRG